MPTAIFTLITFLYHWLKPVDIMPEHGYAIWFFHDSRLHINLYIYFDIKYEGQGIMPETELSIDTINIYYSLNSYWRLISHPTLYTRATGTYQTCHGFTTRAIYPKNAKSGIFHFRFQYEIAV